MRPLRLAGTPIPSHLTLGTWPAQVARLREVGAIVDTTQVVAVHVGHHNPPPDELDRRLLSHGAHAARDGEIIDTERKMTVAYVMNRMESQIIGCPRSAALIAAAYRAVS